MAESGKSTTPPPRQPAYFLLGEFFRLGTPSLDTYHAALGITARGLHDPHYPPKIPAELSSPPARVTMSRLRGDREEWGGGGLLPGAAPFAPPLPICSQAVGGGGEVTKAAGMHSGHRGCEGAVAFLCLGRWLSSNVGTR